MAEIAAALHDALTARRLAGGPGTNAPRMIARGRGWRAADVICTCGRHDEIAAEQHHDIAVAVVAAGTFMYRSRYGRALMTPGSVMLGNPGEAFECSHEHGRGDRCVAFWFGVDYIDRLAADLGLRGAATRFSVAAVPPVRDTAAVVARASAGLFQPGVDWSERALQTAACVLTVAARSPIGAPARVSPSDVARVTDTVRFIDDAAPDSNALTLDRLAERATLSPFHFLRTFTNVTGLTPHQYVRRTKLRRAAVGLSVERSRIIDVALDSGFGDVSAFNRAFRAEFGLSPRQYRRGR